MKGTDMRRKAWAKVTMIASACALAVLSLTVGTTQARASNPVPLPPALVNHPYATSFTGAQLKAWGPGGNSPGNCSSPNRSEISLNSSGYAVLTTSGATNDCVDLQSPHTYPTVD